MTTILCELQIFEVNFKNLNIIFFKDKISYRERGPFPEQEPLFSGAQTACHRTRNRYLYILYDIPEFTELTNRREFSCVIELNNDKYME